MGVRKPTAADLDRVRELARKWGGVMVRHAFGTEGPGLDVDMLQMEEVATAAAQGLAAGTLESATFEQAQAMGTEHACPACGKVCPIKREQRTIQGLNGPFEHDEPACIARPARRDFFPQRPILKMNTHAYTPGVVCKIVEANAHVKSHKVAATMLRRIGDIEISGRHVNSISEEIGAELAARRDQATEDYLHHRRQPPQEAAPELAVIGLDGGRVMTRATGEGSGVHAEQWKEDKVACLLAMQGQTFAADPHPEPPRCFLDAPKVDELVRDIQSHHGPRLEDELPQLAELRLGKEAILPNPPSADDRSPTAKKTERPWPPKRTKNARTCVATMQDCHGFGKMVAAAAYRRGFFNAKRGALLGDGSAWIWGQQEKWFPTLTPITDFMHVVTYLYVTATALASTVTERWQLYICWTKDCWQGRVGQVIQNLQTRLETLGPYPGTSKPPPTDPRVVLQRTITYLSNNQPRMNYPEYRKQGLPVNSSMVESLIKEFNYRVKGTEKFWNRPTGVEAILQNRAGVLSDDNRLIEYIKHRPGNPFASYKKKKAESCVNFKNPKCFLHSRAGESDTTKQRQEKIDADSAEACTKGHSCLAL